MSPIAETVYLDRDNTIDLRLKADGVVVDLSSVTTITLIVGAGTISSNNADDATIRWAKPGYSTGELRLFLGGQAIEPGRYNAELIIFDPTHPNGLHWGNIVLRVTRQ